MTVFSLNDLLDEYRRSARTEREKGTYFEKLAVAFLLNDPVQREQYETVEDYACWAKAHGWDARDVGIDLVAKLRDEEGYAAIQCKFYAPDYRIRKEDIDSFISASGKEPFKRRIIVDSTQRDWSENAESMLRGQALPTLRIGLNELSESPILWETFASKGEVQIAAKKRLRKHQEEALDAVEDGLATADRGKLIMACGTGKTFTSLKIAERLAGQGKRVLFLVPSLALMAQTVREWAADTETPLHAFAVSRRCAARAGACR